MSVAQGNKIMLHIQMVNLSETLYKIIFVLLVVIVQVMETRVIKGK